jgi:hypothetical protein
MGYLSHAYIWGGDQPKEVSVHPSHPHPSHGVAEP